MATSFSKFFSHVTKKIKKGNNYKKLSPLGFGNNFQYNSGIVIPVWCSVPIKLDTNLPLSC
jgi:hypothetical protein